MFVQLVHWGNIAQMRCCSWAQTCRFSSCLWGFSLADSHSPVTCRLIEDSELAIIVNVSMKSCLCVSALWQTWWHVPTFHPMSAGMDCSPPVTLKAAEDGWRSNNCIGEGYFLYSSLLLFFTIISKLNTWKNINILGSRGSFTFSILCMIVRSYIRKLQSLCTPTCSEIVFLLTVGI